ncbi:MAG: two-component sensor histidine kinase [Gammaproteobacteria bacterium HGW-Gammaproteobacteria-3]|nr:MAG: two-component sensor histidine kinase [Gammaproteobacteria bacterium HGW-Gammaproteobacteria-3]
MNTMLSKPAKYRALLFFSLLLTAIAILAVTIVRNIQHFDTILTYVNYSHRIQTVSLRLQHALLAFLIESNPKTKPEMLAKILADMDELIEDTLYLSARTQDQLKTARAQLNGLDHLAVTEQNAHLAEAMALINQTLNQESVEREILLEEINFQTQHELYFALAIFAVPLAGALLFFYFRILTPLNDLRLLLDHLTERDYTPIQLNHLDPLLTPVFASYNRMVFRLAELEAAQQQYANSLQREVRVATQALLEQQHSLARAERLAAVGEMAAELAHEIRNPLAGIQLAFANLRREITDSGQQQRIDLISAELKRVAGLLTGMLDQSRHAPESAHPFDAGAVITDLLTLVRYQIPEAILIDSQLPDTLPVVLPESELRQSLLNLVLNAAQSLKDTPGQITLRARIVADDLIIDVEDTGSGFPDELLTLGIRPFLSHQSKGTGLGLAIVQRFAHHVGGRLELANSPPHGARVSLVLPKGKI